MTDDSDSPPVLHDGETAALAALARNKTPGCDYASGHDIRQQMLRDGYSKAEAVHALRALVDRGRLERVRVNDADGFFYMAYRPTKESRSMHLPDFFAQAPRLVVRDPLADLLGAARDGLFEYGYDDAVKLAGHSCPTVASAYLLTVQALRALYPEAVPERGGVRVEFAQPLGEGVTGVIASVVTLLTGAAQDGGFKGIAGRHVRRDLQAFGCDLPLHLRFTRLDTGAAVDAATDLSGVPGDPAMGPLLQACIAERASAAERQEFADLWQGRVRRILVDHAADTRVFRIVRVA